MASFADKKTIILGKVADGSTLNDGNQAWYDRYIASGSPDAASGMIPRTDYDAGTYEGGPNYVPETTVKESLEAVYPADEPYRAPSEVGDSRQGKFEERVRTASAAVRGGNPTDDEMMWYERYIHSGSPDQATDMVTWDAWEAAGYPGSNTVDPGRVSDDYDPAANIADGTNIIDDYDPFAVPDPEREPTDFDADYGFAEGFVTMYDPFTGMNIQKAVDPNDPHKYTPGRGETRYAWGPDGESIIMDVSQHGWENFGNNNYDPDGPEDGGFQIGYNPPDVAPPTQSWEEGLQGNLGTPNNPSDSIPYIPGTGPVDGDDPFAGGPVDGGGGGIDPTDPTGGGPVTGGPIAPDIPNTRPDLPQPEGGPIIPWTGEGAQADTSWDWDAFVPKQAGDGAWGGYDTDYQAFERYQPGMDSPWGMPNIEGGNESFYQQQFVNMLRDEQGFQNQERQAQARRQDALENPFEAGPTDWSWANSGQGLGAVTPGTGEKQHTGYSLNPTYEGQTNQELWTSMRDFDIFGDRDLQGYMDNYFGRKGNEDIGSSTSWSEGYSPNSAFGGIDPTSWEGMNHAFQVQGGINSILGNLYQGNQQGPQVPVGYASPVPAY